jgi:hypothetical protein
MYSSRLISITHQAQHFPFRLATIWGQPKSHRCSIRWSNYIDILTGTELLTATMPVFKVGPGQSMCDPDATEVGSSEHDDLAELLGVVAFDMNVVSPLTPLYEQPSWGSFWSNIIADSCSCPAISLSPAQLEALRRSSPGSQTCGASANVHAGVNPGTSSTSTCGDGIQRLNRGAAGATCEPDLFENSGESWSHNACGMRGWLIFLIVIGTLITMMCIGLSITACARRRGKTKSQPELPRGP